MREFFLGAAIGFFICTVFLVIAHWAVSEPRDGSQYGTLEPPRDLCNGQKIMTRIFENGGERWQEFWCADRPSYRWGVKL